MGEAADKYADYFEECRRKRTLDFTFSSVATETEAKEIVATGSRAPAASAVMLAAAVTAGVTSSAVRVPAAETPPAALEALRRMPAASHVEAA